MKEFSRVDGWLYKLVGGPADGMVIRMNIGQHLPPDSHEQILLFSNHTDGHYHVDVVPGKFARFRGHQLEWVQYVWVEMPMGSDAVIPLNARGHDYELKAAA